MAASRKPTREDLADLRRLEGKLGVRFKDSALLMQALTHSSFAHEHHDDGAQDNERLEFLGDAVIELVTAELLFKREPEVGEGALTLDRAAMVSTGALAVAARRIELGEHLRVGRGVENSGGRQLDSLLANAVEAVIGAITKTWLMEESRRRLQEAGLGPRRGDG